MQVDKPTVEGRKFGADPLCGQKFGGQPTGQRGTFVTLQGWTGVTPREFWTIGNELRHGLFAFASKARSKKI